MVLLRTCDGLPSLLHEDPLVILCPRYTGTEHCKLQKQDHSVYQYQLL